MVTLTLAAGYNADSSSRAALPTSSRTLALVNTSGSSPYKITFGTGFNGAPAWTTGSVSGVQSAFRFVSDGSAKWTEIAGPNLAANAQVQSSAYSPTAPASTSTYKMQGLGSASTPPAITPIRTGRLLITVSGTCIASTVTAGDGIGYQISYGTGSAPANAASLTGTQVGAVQVCTNPTTVTAADVNFPFSYTVVVTGLTIGTAYWVDLAAESVATASSGGLSNVTVTAVEQ